MANTTTELEISSGEWTQITIGIATHMVITNETEDDLMYSFSSTTPTIGHTLKKEYDNILEGIASDVWIKKASGKPDNVTVTKFGV